MNRTNHKPFAQSCAENQQVILNTIAPLLQTAKKVLEIGSGTGQHAVYFARAMPHLLWQTSDRPENHQGIQMWIADSGLSNVLAPLELDVARSKWPQGQHYDAIFSANTCHIMHQHEVESFITHAAKQLPAQGRLMIYGPFNYQGHYTSDSNAAFDQWLKSRDPESGIKDFEYLHQLASTADMSLLEDYEMPQNNRILVWQKH